jgi:ribosomal protein S21
LAEHEIGLNVKNKPAHVSVHIKETRGNVERLIRRFLKKAKKEKIVEQVRDRKHYKKPSVKKKEKRIKAERFRMKEQRKRQRAEETRVRKNK